MRGRLRQERGAKPLHRRPGDVVERRGERAVAQVEAVQHGADRRHPMQRRGGDVAHRHAAVGHAGFEEHQFAGEQWRRDESEEAAFGIVVAIVAIAREYVGPGGGDETGAIQRDQVFAADEAQAGHHPRGRQQPADQHDPVGRADDAGVDFEIERAHRHPRRRVGGGFRQPRGGRGRGRHRSIVRMRRQPQGESVPRCPGLQRLPGLRRAGEERREIDPGGWRRQREHPDFQKMVIGAIATPLGDGARHVRSRGAILCGGKPCQRVAGIWGGQKMVHGAGIPPRRDRRPRDRGMRQIPVGVEIHRHFRRRAVPPHRPQRVLERAVRALQHRRHPARLRHIPRGVEQQMRQPPLARAGLEVVVVAVGAAGGDHHQVGQVRRMQRVERIVVEPVPVTREIAERRIMRVTRGDRPRRDHPGDIGVPRAIPSLVEIHVGR